ncbi:MAG: DUF6132 family protein [Tenuifilaceae bacterium]
MKESCETNTPKPKTFNELIRSSYFWKPASGILIGGLLGFLFYYFVGCTSGTCAITSNPYSSIIMGSVIGLLMTNSPCKTC